MNEIKDFSRVIAELEDGQFNADCSAKLQESLKALQQRCDIDGMRTAKHKLRWQSRLFWTAATSQ